MYFGVRNELWLGDLASHFPHRLGLLCRILTNRATGWAEGGVSGVTFPACWPLHAIK